MSKLEAIKKVVVEANPSILELQFGCEVEFRGENFIFISGGMAGLYTIWNKRCSAVHADPKEVKNLGCPIRFYDCALAIDDHFVKKGSDDYQKQISNAIIGLYDAWIGEDDLSKQPRAIDFLYAIFYS